MKHRFPGGRLSVLSLHVVPEYAGSSPRIRSPPPCPKDALIRGTLSQAAWVRVGVSDLAMEGRPGRGASRLHPELLGKALATCHPKLESDGWKIIILLVFINFFKYMYSSHLCSILEVFGCFCDQKEVIGTNQKKQKKSK